MLSSTTPDVPMDHDHTNHVRRLEDRENVIGRGPGTLVRPIDNRPFIFTADRRRSTTVLATATNPFSNPSLAYCFEQMPWNLLVFGDHRL